MEALSEHVDDEKNGLAGGLLIVSLVIAGVDVLVGDDP